MQTAAPRAPMPMVAVHRALLPDSRWLSGPPGAAKRSAASTEGALLAPSACVVQRVNGVGGTLAEGAKGTAPQHETLAASLRTNFFLTCLKEQDG